MNSIWTISSLCGIVLLLAWLVSPSMFILCVIIMFLGYIVGRVA